MKKIILFLLLTVSMNVFAVSVFTGNDLIRWFKSHDYIQINAYVAGVIDGFETEPEGENKRFICIPIGTEIQQISQITYNFLQKNPTKWVWTGSFIVVNALIESYPCKK